LIAIKNLKKRRRRSALQEATQRSAAALVSNASKEVSESSPFEGETVWMVSREGIEPSIL